MEVAPTESVLMGPLLMGPLLMEPLLMGPPLMVGPGPELEKLVLMELALVRSVLKGPVLILVLT